MMKNNISAICLFLTVCLPAFAQEQTDEEQKEIDRTVTVEREFQPTIQSAGKLYVRPEVHELEIQPTEVEYSTFSSPMKDVESNSVVPLGFSETKFTHSEPTNGFLRGGVGHTATVLDFNYKIQDRKNISLDLKAYHHGQWGRKMLSKSGIGLDFAKRFSKTEFFFGADGNNIFFTRYGRYFEYTDLNKMNGHFVGLEHYSDFQQADKANQWEINTRIGVRSAGNDAIKYSIQTGYETFLMRQGSAEHIINSNGSFSWQQGGHKVGANLKVENHFYQEDANILAAMNTDLYYTKISQTYYHAIKLNPYYQYTGKRFYVRAGVNLDFCIGKGKVFLPSPDVYAEGFVARDWLAIYGGVSGNYSTSSVREHFGYLRYLHPENEIATLNNRNYTPVNPFLGMKIRPTHNLLLQLYAAFNYTKYDVFYRPDAWLNAEGQRETNGYFCLVGSDHQHWTIGGKMSYHYKDIISFTLHGFYNIWNMKSPYWLDATKTYYDMGLKNNHILDRPSWGLTLRIDGKIDSKWSLYSDNYFGGGRYALDGVGSIVELKPTVDLNLGVQYSINKWLAVYLQLNNYINRKNEFVYGYQTQGINFVAGVTYVF